MKTLQLFSHKFEFVPAATSWYLADLGEARGNRNCSPANRPSVSRLLLLCCRLGFEVGRYISLERLIEQNKERYYETLEQSSLGWHDGKHDPWPYINYILSIIRTAYREFEQRLGQIQSPKGEKTSLVLHAIDSILGPFTMAELQNKCPNVSVDMIQRVLKNLRAKDQVECLGRDQNARWQKPADWELGNVE
jgi:hypothetical protein